VEKSKIKLGLPFMVLHLGHKFRMICLSYKKNYLYLDCLFYFKISFNVPGIDLGDRKGSDLDASAICQRFSEIGFDYNLGVDMTEAETFMVLHLVHKFRMICLSYKKQFSLSRFPFLF
jgi:hypothetical protein